MNRGFNYYYREGLKASAKALYRNKCFFKYILYFLAEFFGRILIIFNLHFNLADIQQGYVLRKQSRFDFSSSFKGVGKSISIGTYLLTLCLEFLLFIAGIVVVTAFAAVTGAIGYGVSKILSYEDYRLFILLFAAPAAPLLAIYALAFLLIFSPTAYIIANNEKISAGETIGACFKTMLNNGKMTVFLSYFISTLIKLLYLGAVGAGGYFVITLFVPENYFIVALIGWTVVSGIGYLLFAPIFTLANRSLKEHLFEDIVLDPLVAARSSEKINLSVCNGKKLDKQNVSQNLASLFEYTEDKYRILQEDEKKSGLLIGGTEKGGKKDKKTKAVKTQPQNAVEPQPKKRIAEPQPANRQVSNI